MVIKIKKQSLELGPIDINKGALFPWNEFQLQVGRVSMMSPSNSNVKCTVLGTGEDFLPWPIQSIHVKDQPMGATNDLLLCFFKYDWLQPHLVPTSGIRI